MPMMPPPGAPPGAMPSPGGAMPGGAAGSPPGAPAAMAPGAGAGRQAAADHAIKGSLDKFYLALGVFEPGSKKHKALVSAVKLISDAFGAEGGDQSGIPASVMASAKNGVGPQPQGGAIPPGIAGGAMGGPPPSPSPQPQGAV